MIHMGIYTPVDSRITEQEIEDKLRVKFQVMCSDVRTDLNISCSDGALLFLLFKVLMSGEIAIRHTDENGEPI